MLIGCIYKLLCTLTFDAHKCISLFSKVQFVYNTSCYLSGGGAKSCILIHYIICVWRRQVSRFFCGFRVSRSSSPLNVPDDRMNDRRTWNMAPSAGTNSPYLCK